MSPSTPHRLRYVGCRTVGNVNATIEELVVCELGVEYLVVFPTPEAVVQMYIENRYVDGDLSALKGEETSPRELCFGVVYRLMLQQFLQRVMESRVYSQPDTTAEELEKRTQYEKRLNRDHERLTAAFRWLYGQKLMGREAGKEFRVKATRMESWWMVNACKNWKIDLTHEVVHIDI